MATININALNPAGSDLFADNESYLKDLSEAELNQQGGLIWTPITTTVLTPFLNC